MKTLEQLNQVFCDIFEDDEIRILPETTAADIEGWDSLMHVALFIETEKVFGVRFMSADIAGAANVGDLVVLIDQKLGQ